MRCSFVLLGDLFYGILNQLFPKLVKFLVAPAAMVRLSLKTVLNDKPPALVFRASALALEANDQFLQFVSGQDPGLLRHGMRLGIPARSSFR